MKNFIALLFLLALTLSGSRSLATHFMGVDIYYQCLGPCTYRIFHSVYYDCTGAATPPITGNPPTASATFTGLPVGCQPTQPTAIGNWMPLVRTNCPACTTNSNWNNVTPVCPSAAGLTGCYGNPNPQINGVLEARWYRDYNVCGAGSPPCTAYRVAWSSCCRNGAITSGADNQGIYTGNTLINLAITPCNSSPTFTTLPVPYICAGQVRRVNQGAFDPDGDSLSYSLVPCLQGAGNPNTYFAGYSPSQPLGPSWNVTLDPVTGDITFTPNPNPGGGNIVVGVFCIEVREWRNGINIGSVVRDMQITVLPSCPSPGPQTGGITNVQISGVPANPLSATSIYTCANVPLCFDIPVIPQATGLNYTVSWKNRIPGATFFDASNPAAQNTFSGTAPVARFCWTPPRDGVYSFVIEVTDDACPVFGFLAYTIVLNISKPLLSTRATAVQLNGCNNVQYTAVPRNLIPSPYNNIFSYQWSGNGNLQPGTGPYRNRTVIDDSTFIHNYPRPGNYFYDLRVRDTFGCEASIRNIVPVIGGVTADAGPDLTICSGYQFQMGAPPIPGQIYRWRPGTGLSDTTVADPFFSRLNLNQGVTSSINFELYVTDSLCEAWDYADVILNPSLQVRISPTEPVICRGDSITLTASGGQNFLWSTGDTSRSIVVKPTTGPITVSAVTFSNGCTSLPELNTVYVAPGPQASIAGALRVCPGDGTILFASGGFTYQWDDNTSSPVRVFSNITTTRRVWVIPTDTLGCIGDTVFATISPYSRPAPSFSASAVCQNNESQFFDATTIGAGSLVSWRWDFDDPSSGGSNLSNQQNPVHTFSQAGTYNVTLTVTSDNGCVNTVTQPVIVQPVPTVDFIGTNVCDGLPNTFVSTSVVPGGAIASTDWRFGDGATGSGPIVTHQYPAPGFYNATLYIVSTGGCRDSFTQTVFVHPNPVADFEVTSACQDSVVFTFNGSSVGGGLDFIQSYSWDFGDPASGSLNFSSLRDPTHAYTTPGQKTIELTIATGEGCVNTISRTVTIFENPNADFIVDGQCINELITYTDNSTSNPATPINQWLWSYGDGRTGSGPVATLTYESTGPGRYPVTLRIFSNEGCPGRITKDVDVFPAPEPLFNADPVCIGDTMRFQDFSKIAYTSISVWDWDFGGPGRGIRGIPNPRWIYDESGIFQVVLNLTSEKGCQNQWSRSVEVYEAAPLPEITPDTVCFNDPAFLLAGAPINTTVRWYNNLRDRDPFYTGFSYVTPPMPFTTTYFVQVTSKDGCIGPRFPVTAVVGSSYGLSINPSRSVVELPLGLVNFTAASPIPIVNYSWHFGDGTQSDMQEPAHEYERPGLYEVTLTVIDANGCQYSTTTFIEVKKVVSAFIPSAFSPNGDGINDYFEIGNYNLERFSIRVYNRWGQLVYEANQPDFRWNGMSLKGGAVPEGVYVYVARYLDIEGKEVEQKGTITIIR